jgi:eukaryotic-like serine/threonine-protein kinase
MIGESEPAGYHLPERFGSFILAKLIHRGGMGELFLARSPLDDYPVVVVKRLRPDLGGMVPLERFKHEANLAVRLRHPNVVQSLNAGEVSARRYLAFEPIVGRSVAQLSDRLNEHRAAAPARFVTRIMVEVLSALAYVHTACDERGEHLHLLHRDITPGNVLVGYDGEVKVTDFGVARSLLSVNLGLTQPGTVVGTPAYVAPEFLRGEALGAPLDLYGLGGVAYRLLTGHSPFPGTARVVVMKAMGQKPRPCAELRPDAPPWLTDLIDRMLSHEAGDRPQDAAELKQVLTGVAESVGCLASSAQLGRWISQHFESEKGIDEATMRAVALIDLESISPAMSPTLVLAESGSAPQILPMIAARKERSRPSISVPVIPKALPAQARKRPLRAGVGAIALGAVLGLASASNGVDARWERVNDVSVRLDAAAERVALENSKEATEILRRADREFARGDWVRSESYLEELERVLD